MARMVEALGFDAGYLGGGSTGYAKVALEANLNLTEMCQAALDIGAVSSLPLILDGACGFGDPMHIHRTIGMAEAAGFAAIEIEDQLMPKRAHHHVGIEHMIPLELMAAKVREAVAARRSSEFLIVARTNAMRASDFEDALRRGEAYRKAGADLLLLSMARSPEQLRAIAERLGGPLMYLTGRGGLAGLGMTLRELGDLGYRIVADPTTPLLAAFAAWQKVYRDLATDFGSAAPQPPEWATLEHDLFKVQSDRPGGFARRRTVDRGKGFRSRVKELYGRNASEDFAAQTFVFHKRLAPLACRLNPVHFARQHDASRPHRVHLGILRPRRQGSVVAQRLRRVDQPPPRPNDHRVAGAKMLFPARIDRPHRLGDGLVLQIDAIDAGIAFVLALRVAIDLVVVAGVSHASEPSEPVRRIEIGLGDVQRVTPRRSTAHP